MEDEMVEHNTKSNKEENSIMVNENVNEEIMLMSNDFYYSNDDMKSNDNSSSRLNDDTSTKG